MDWPVSWLFMYIIRGLSPRIALVYHFTDKRCNDTSYLFNIPRVKKMRTNTSSRGELRKKKKQKASYIHDIWLKLKCVHIYATLFTTRCLGFMVFWGTVMSRFSGSLWCVVQLLLFPLSECILQLWYRFSGTFECIFPYFVPVLWNILMRFAISALAYSFFQTRFTTSILANCSFRRDVQLLSWLTRSFRRILQLLSWLTRSFRRILQLLSWLTRSFRRILQLLSWLTRSFRRILQLLSWLTRSFRRILQLLSWLTRSFRRILQLLSWLTRSFRCVCNIVSGSLEFRWRVSLSSPVGKNASTHPAVFGHNR